MNTSWRGGASAEPWGVLGRLHVHYRCCLADCVGPSRFLGSLYKTVQLLATLKISGIFLSGIFRNFVYQLATKFPAPKNKSYMYARDRHRQTNGQTERRSVFVVGRIINIFYKMPPSVHCCCCCWYCWQKWRRKTHSARLPGHSYWKPVVNLRSSPSSFIFSRMTKGGLRLYGHGDGFP